MNCPFGEHDHSAGNHHCLLFEERRGEVIHKTIMGSFCSGANEQGGNQNPEETGRGSPRVQRGSRHSSRHTTPRAGAAAAAHRSLSDEDKSASMVKRKKLQEKMSRYAAPNIVFENVLLTSKGHHLPKARKCHSMAVIGEHTILLFGGLCTSEDHPQDPQVMRQSCDKLQVSSQLFQFAPRDDHWRTPNSGSGEPPCARASHIAATYDDHMFIFGAHNGSCNSIFEYIPAVGNWVTIDVYGDPPEPVAGASACVAGDVLLIFGGDNGKSVTNRLHSYDFQGRRWGCLKDAPCQDMRLFPRRDHSAVIFEDRMLVFGGFATKSDDLEFIQFHAPTRSWQRVEVSASSQTPELRGGHTCAMYHQFMLMFGGMHHRKFLNDLWVFDCVLGAWCQVNLSDGPSAAPCPRAFACDAICGRHWYMHGGTDDQFLFRDFYRVDCNEICKACDPSFVPPTAPVATTSASAGEEGDGGGDDGRAKPMPGDAGYNQYNVRNFSPLWKDVTHRASRIQIE